MGTTPAAELARVKVQHPGWSIHGSDGTRFVARRWLADGRVQQVRATTLTALEHGLWLREKFRNLHDGAA